METISERYNLVLIITGCIRPTEGVYKLAIKDPQIREKQYIDSIKWFIQRSDFKRIIFCDNSGQKVNREIVELANREKKIFEWISYHGDSERVLYKGKGFGEGECLSYAINHSRIINENDYICKITGRLIIKNINSFIQKYHYNKNYFFALRSRENIGRRCKMIDTRFYGMPLCIYKEYFEDGYSDVDDNKKIYLENVFYHIVYKNNLSIEKMFFYPQFRGYSASTGGEYKDTKIKNIIKQFMTLGGGCYP